MKEVIILLGPTGAGKTAASLLLARALHTEIISADSMQIYRHMDIGTAKPTREELARIRHHMIDIVEPWESYSTGRYIEEVTPIISALHMRNAIPLIVGGTGLYIKALTRGIFSGPSADKALRDALLQKEKADAGALYRQLQAVDPRAAESITPADLRRTVRALEVFLSGNKKMSEMQTEHTEKLPFDFIKIGLTRDRKELYGMIDRRVDDMFAMGLVDEVKNVLQLISSEARRQGNAEIRESELSSLQAIGYKELLRHLRGELSLPDAVALIKQRSRNYAKRQFTWFRKEEGIRWIDITGITDTEVIFERIEAAIGNTDGI
ncbi:MAG TPA: tRNA (adenosine(37)-N6)-dimethylallyltransferase MiaA [Dissulfurispiraceae bacterium]|nr:tRNA (adenosine(37)-N6)-dimethylallyltransferase MiaA [Dissulfurispiraceae bacterium]